MFNIGLKNQFFLLLFKNQFFYYLVYFNYYLTYFYYYIFMGHAFFIVMHFFFLFNFLSFSVIIVQEHENRNSEPFT